MLYELLTSIYNYLFPNKKSIIKLEYESLYNEVLEDIDNSIVMVPLVKHSDEELAVVKAKKLNIEPIVYKYLYMKQCNACHKIKFSQNVSYFTKLHSKNDFLTACKDDESCLKTVSEKSKLN